MLPTYSNNIFSVKTILEVLESQVNKGGRE